MMGEFLDKLAMGFCMFFGCIGAYDGIRDMDYNQIALAAVLFFIAGYFYSQYSDERLK